MFIFLIALGSDYNIFISTRIRAESFKRGLRDGTERAVAVTGGVLTSAGLVLAGTFLILAAEPVKYLVEVGLGVAIGVLLDTFIVRSALVPGLVTAVGARIGWPGRRWECAEECPVPPDERARERAGRLGGRAARRPGWASRHSRADRHRRHRGRHDGGGAGRPRHPPGLRRPLVAPRRSPAARRRAARRSATGAAGAPSPPA